MMKSFFIAIIFVSISTSALGETKTSSPKSKKGNFLKQIDLAAGEYELKKETAGCQDGYLRLSERGNIKKTGATLMLGAHSILRGLGVKEYSSEERGTKWTITSMVEKNRATSIVKEKNKGIETEYQNTLKRESRNSFIYSQKVIQDNKVIHDIECSLVRKK